MYGTLPKHFGIFNITDTTSKYFLYLPIKMADLEDIRIPEELSKYRKLVDKVLFEEDVFGKYVYLSVEVSPIKCGIPQKRPGWHSDGFLSDDINYIWTNCFPTVFNTTKFAVSEDHKISMEQFEAQADPKNDYIFEEGSLLRMDQFVIHRAAIPDTNCHARIFVKISISKFKYNLKGNSHNELFQYRWDMYDRRKVRNHPFLLERDYILSDEEVFELNPSPLSEEEAAIDITNDEF